MPTRWPIALVSIAPIAACSLLVASEDLAGTRPSGDASAAGEIDSANPTADAADVAADGAPADAGAPWCLAHHPDATYCADFDETRPLTDYGIVNGLARIAPAIGVGGSPAVLFELPDAATNAFLRRPLFGAGAKIELAYTVQFAEPGTRSYLEVSHVEFATGADTYFLLLSATHDEISFAEIGAADTRDVKTMRLDLSQPRRLWFGVDATSTPWRLRMSVDGIDVADEPAQLAPALAPPELIVSYGAIYADVSTPRSVVIDNVVVRRSD